MEIFIDKYKITKLDNLIGQDTAIKELRLFVNNFPNVKKRAVLVYGTIGTGKTTAVHALAKELDYEIIEVNASDFRDRESIEKIIGENSKQMSLFNRGKIILIDEVDAISGNEDRGGVQALNKILENTSFPIIMTTNDLNHDKIKELKKSSTPIEFKTLSNKDIELILKKICENEKLISDEITLKKISINAGGDVRAAINDLQSLIVENKIVLEELPERNYEISTDNALNTIFKSKSLQSYKITEFLDIDLNELILWLDENLPIEYDNIEDLEKAYTRLGKADLFRARIIRWQHWAFMYYQSIIACGGVSISRNKSTIKPSNFKRPMLPLKIWQANMRNGKKLSISKKLSPILHISIKHVFKDFNYYKEFIKQDKITEEIKLSEEEIDYLKEL
ncbi:MAG: replication factor C large subunit [Nanoarchaeota archaeon]